MDGYLEQGDMSQATARLKHEKCGPRSTGVVIELHQRQPGSILLVIRIRQWVWMPAWEWEVADDEGGVVVVVANTPRLEF